jgi:hypothetical protein
MWMQHGRARLRCALSSATGLQGWRQLTATPSTPTSGRWGAWVCGVGEEAGIISWVRVGLGACADHRYDSFCHAVCWATLYVGPRCMLQGVHHTNDCCALWMADVDHLQALTAVCCVLCAAQDVDYL